MKSFSQRKGLKKVRTEFQVDSMDKELRNRLWNVLDYHYWSQERSLLPPALRSPWEPSISSKMQSFLNKLWHYYFKEPVDTIPSSWSNVHKLMRTRYFECKWNEAYDFIEFVATSFPNAEANRRFRKTCNEVLESELSAYRFVGEIITQITSSEEISEIEEALETPLKSVRTHLENSLKLLSDRKSPDYRNSIKESISAVEAICKIVAKNKKAKLGQALDIIESKISLHGALKRAFESLYGYTSDADGIRHALMDEPSLSLEDAKFMLVSCSAFINYLISKASKAGLNIGK